MRPFRTPFCLQTNPRKNPWVSFIRLVVLMTLWVYDTLDRAEGTKTI